MPAQTVIQLRRDTAANWTSTDPTLAAGEAGFETDTSKLKIGDGSTAWSSLAYFGNLDSLNNVGDVTITSAATGEVLRFDGSAWVNETLVIADVDGLQGALDGKAASSHTHAISDVTNLQSTLDSKPQNLYQLFDVSGANDASDGQVLTYNSAGMWWTPADPAGGGGITVQDIYSAQVSLTPNTLYRFFSQGEGTTRLDLYDQDNSLAPGESVYFMQMYANHFGVGPAIGSSVRVRSSNGQKFFTRAPGSIIKLTKVDNDVYLLSGDLGTVLSGAGKIWTVAGTTVRSIFPFHSDIFGSLQYITDTSFNLSFIDSVPSFVRPVIAVTEDIVVVYFSLKAFYTHNGVDWYVTSVEQEVDSITYNGIAYQTSARGSGGGYFTKDLLNFYGVPYSFQQPKIFGENLSVGYNPYFGSSIYIGDKFGYQSGLNDYEHQYPLTTWNDSFGFGSFQNIFSMTYIEELGKFFATGAFSKALAYTTSGMEWDSYMLADGAFGGEGEGGGIYGSQSVYRSIAYGNGIMLVFGSDQFNQYNTFFSRSTDGGQTHTVATVPQQSSPYFYDSELGTMLKFIGDRFYFWEDSFGGFYTSKDGITWTYYSVGQSGVEEMASIADKRNFSHVARTSN